MSKEEKALEEAVKRYREFVEKIKKKEEEKPKPKSAAA